MGGGEGLNIFEHEEQKVSSDLVDQIHRVMTEQSLYSIVALGTFVYVILLYVFLARDQAHIQSNPEVQWHLKRIREEDNELIDETKERYKEHQRERRLKRRAWYKKYRKEKLDKMDQKERQRILDKEFKKREERLMMERQLYRHALSVQSNPNLNRDDRKLLKKMVKQDVKKMRQYTKEDLNESSSDDEVTRAEDKIYYGSDSDTSQQSGYDEVLQNHKLPSKLRNWDEKSSSELSGDEEDYIIDDDQIYVDEYYDEEAESEYYEEDMESDDMSLEDTMEMAFEEVESPQTSKKKVYEEEKKQSKEYQKVNQKKSSSKPRRKSSDSNDSSGSQTPRSDKSGDSSLNTSQSSEKSTKVIEFDEDGNILEGKRTTIEMTDLKETRSGANSLMREFVPAGKVNQSQKKREKRKIKKEEEERKQKFLEAEKARKAYEKAKKDASVAGKPFEPTQKLKKKIAPKKVIHDMEGDWEVVDKKKTVFIEEESDSDESEEEEKIVPRNQRSKMKNININ